MIAYPMYCIVHYPLMAIADMLVPNMKYGHQKPQQPTCILQMPSGNNITAHHVRSVEPLYPER